MSCHIDPRVQPDSQRERELLAECRKRGLSVLRLHADGTAVRIFGPGVFVTAAALRNVAIADLQPSGRAA